MNIRKDLESVSSQISRLLSIGNEFRNFDRDWSHFKNKEDFHFLLRTPQDERNKIEVVYSDGRDMAIYMSDALLSINSDFGRYPTLTAIVDGFNNSWVAGNYDPNVPDIAKSTCEKHNINLWSVNKMIDLFKKQEDLLSAVRVTLGILRGSDLYKMENGQPIMKQEANINVSGVSGSSIVINSSGATSNAMTNYNEPEVFGNLISAIRSSQLDSDAESKLIESVQALASSHKGGGFKEAYKNFMQNAATHATVISPFLSSLTALL